MRINIVHEEADRLKYEIRKIIEAGEKLKSKGVQMYWENIGDPIAKGQLVPEWIKEIIADTAKNDNSSYGYSPTKGFLETREYLAEKIRKENNLSITAENIFFFNGLGDAISTIYAYLSEEARILIPSPSYPAHSSAEAFHAKSKQITYNLNPYNNWLPDIDEIRNKVKNNPSIVGILIVNPDNPTGLVYPESVLKKIVAVAKEFDLFIISDEIYANLAYNQEKMVSLSRVLGDVCGIVMRGLSKEMPWPGSRCGWIEIYNKNNDPRFAKFIKTLEDAKRMEVCSTTLPQKVLPKIFSDGRYGNHLKESARQYERKAEMMHDILKDESGIIVNKPEGAFYATIVFKKGILKNNQVLAIENEKAKKVVEELTKDNIPLDKRFVYYLMASSGICVVPLSGMNSDLEGFRITLLETDENLFRKNIETIKEKIREYIS